MERNESLWMATAAGREFGVQMGDVEADVAVIGGGIAGILCAYQLEQEGFRVVVLEANRVCAGVTGYTTAKVTSGHSLIYDKLSSTVGKEQARVYGEANQWGVEWIAQQGIDCDLQRKAMLVFAEDGDQRDQALKEFEVARDLGLPVSWTESVDLPISTQGAISYANQVQFHPRKFVLGLAERLKGQIFERTRVMEVEEDDICTVTTDRGKVRARFVVVASHYPIYDPAMYFSRLAPYRDYAVAARVRGELPKDMSIGAGEESMSFRTQPHPDGELLIVSGKTHKVGQADTSQCYEELEKYVRENFEVDSMPYRWSTQDTSTLDRMPYIGWITSGSEHVFVITGFNAWGMATSAYAGRIVADLAAGRENPWADVFKPRTFKGVDSVRTFASENANVAKHLVGDKFTDTEDRTIESLQPGEAAILKVDGDKVAAYRDKSGGLHVLAPQCTHMGCDVAWNSAEESWDCPCHGSRFDKDGQVIQGPAIKNMEQKQVVLKPDGPELI